MTILIYYFQKKNKKKMQNNTSTIITDLSPESDFFNACMRFKKHNPEKYIGALYGAINDYYGDTEAYREIQNETMKISKMKEDLNRASEIIKKKDLEVKGKLQALKKRKEGRTFGVVEFPKTSSFVYIE